MLLLMAIVSLGLHAAAEAETNSWSEVSANSKPTLGARARPHSAPAKALGVLTVYTDRGDFQAAMPGLLIEDFTGTNVGPSDVGGCAPPLSSATNDACFPTGGVVNGFELDIDLVCLPGVGSVGNYVVVTTGAFGAPFNAVGPEFFCDDTILRFDPPANAVGFDLLQLLTPVNATIDIYDATGALLGSTTADGSPTGAFWGVTSPFGIGRLEIAAAADGGELLGNLEFGVLPAEYGVPALSGYGAALLCVLLVIAGLVVIILRR
jgi:hypothetical protein